MLAHFFVMQETLRLKKLPGLTMPQTCLLVDAALPRTGAPAERATQPTAASMPNTAEDTASSQVWPKP